MNLLDLPPQNWGERVAELGEPSYRGRQIAHWVFRKGITDPGQMTNLPAATRNHLLTTLGLTLPELRSIHPDPDGTVKIAMELEDGSVIESVLIPRKGRMTLCLSTQVGCGIGCRFCRTAEMGLVRNLTAAEIVAQWVLATRALSTPPPPGESIPENGTGEKPEGEGGIPASIDHLVFMGMGEPLANLEGLIPAIRTFVHPDGADLSPRRITVSTSGLPPKMRLLGEANTGVHLAVSLTAPDDLLRQELMPVGRIYPIGEILSACRSFPVKPRERITFEYVLLEGVNDRPDQARALGRLLSPFKSKVNLIPFNPFEGSPFSRPSEEVVEEFRRILSAFHLTATVRRTMGESVRAACGQLAWEEKMQERSQNKGGSRPWKPIARSL